MQPPSHACRRLPELDPQKLNKTSEPPQRPNPWVWTLVIFIAQSSLLSKPVSRSLSPVLGLPAQSDFSPLFLACNTPHLQIQARDRDSSPYGMRQRKSSSASGASFETLLPCMTKPVNLHVGAAARDSQCERTYVPRAEEFSCWWRQLRAGANR